MIISAVLVWIIAVTSCFMMCSSQSFNQTRDLLQALLENYDRRLRPNLNQSQPTVVYVSFGILNIDEFDEVNSKFSVTGFMQVEWVNEIITWNPDANHGISMLKFPVTDVWYPILVLVYTHGEPSNPVDDWMRVSINYNGYAWFQPRDVYKATCTVDVTYYPFDIQTCSLIFVTWDYLVDDVQLQTHTGHVHGDFFNDHGEWEIIDNSTIVGYPVSSVVTFRLVLRRKPLFFVVNIILPIILMSLLNILVFVLPPQSGERVSYSITVLLAIAVFLTVVGDNLPKTSTPMSVLSYFLMISLINSALICVFTIMNLRIYFKDSSESFPAWAHFIVRITCSRPRGPSQYVAEIGCNTENSASASSRTNVAVTGELKVKRGYFTWFDVSNAVDKLCVLFFLLVTVMNCGCFMFLVTRQ